MTQFSTDVYALLREIPEGKVTTYGALARRMGIRSAQAIGQVCKRNPDAPNTPCHRVVASDGTLGGFRGEREGSAIRHKVALLKKEGVVVRKGVVQDFQKCLHEW